MNFNYTIILQSVCFQFEYILWSMIILLFYILNDRHGERMLFIHVKLGINDIRTNFFTEIIDLLKKGRSTSISAVKLGSYNISNVMFSLFTKHVN